MDSGKPFCSGTDGASGVCRGWRQGLVLGLAAFVLVHGMIASQLLVVCVRADGVTLIEMIGQDPCRHPLGEPHSCGRSDLVALARGFDDGPGPCVDLSLNRPAMAQQGLDEDAPARIAGTMGADALQCAASLPLSPRVMFHRFPREPAPAVQEYPQFSSPLRI